MKQITRFWTYDSGEARLELELVDVPPPPLQTIIEMQDGFYRASSIRYIIDSPQTDEARMRCEVTLATTTVHGEGRPCR